MPCPTSRLGRTLETHGRRESSSSTAPLVLYCAVVDGLTGKECISVAVAADPQGPFVDNSTAPLECQLDLGGSIDPSPFLDASGTPYLVWKSQGATGQPSAIWSTQLTADGIGLVGSAAQILVRPSQSWERGVVEGPSMLLWSGRYYLFYSANNWDSANYAIGVATCPGPNWTVLQASHSCTSGVARGDVRPWWAFILLIKTASCGWPFILIARRQWAIPIVVCCFFVGWRLLTMFPLLSLRTDIHRQRN